MSPVRSISELSGHPSTHHGHMGRPTAELCNLDIAWESLTISATEARATILKLRAHPGTFSSTCSLRSSQLWLNHYIPLPFTGATCTTIPKENITLHQPRNRRSSGTLQAKSAVHCWVPNGPPVDKVIRAFKCVALGPSSIGGHRPLMKTNRDPGSAFQVTSGSTSCAVMPYK